MSVTYMQQRPVIISRMLDLTNKLSLQVNPPATHPTLSTPGFCSEHTSPHKTSPACSRSIMQAVFTSDI